MSKMLEGEVHVPWNGTNAFINYLLFTHQDPIEEQFALLKKV